MGGWGWNPIGPVASCWDPEGVVDSIDCRQLASSTFFYNVTNTSKFESEIVEFVGDFNPFQKMFPKI